MPQLQSAYRPCHSTETVVTKVLSDVLSAIYNGSVAALVLLDLSAAFDTVDHEILLRRLELFGIGGCNIRWFKSYLVGRRQFVCISSSSSSPTVCTSSSSSPTVIVPCVPQGSVLGSILFLLYIAELQTLIQDSGLNPHHYADDIQIYSFCSLTPSSCVELQHRISECIDGVASWLRSSRLQLNTSKIEIIWISSRCHFFQLPQQPFCVVNDQVAPVGSRSRDFHRYICANKVQCRQDCMLCSTAAASKHSSVSFWSGSAVAGVLPGVIKIGPWKRSTCRDFSSPSEAFAVSDKLSRTTGFFVIKVRPRDATPASTA